ncbi:hypothetical protein BDR03DRAFT_964530 [Suillus americanus]|nr:hypothetical protein BDR03DRAFT_964530 [Suillus americanus]
MLPMPSSTHFLSFTSSGLFILVTHSLEENFPLLRFGHRQPASGTWYEHLTPGPWERISPSTQAFCL